MVRAGPRPREASGNQRMAVVRAPVHRSRPFVAATRRAALRYSRTLARIQQSVEDPRLEAGTRADMGEPTNSAETDERAIRFFHQALDLSRAGRDRVGEARPVSVWRALSAANGGPAARRDARSNLRWRSRSPCAPRSRTGISVPPTLRPSTSTTSCTWTCSCSCAGSTLGAVTGRPRRSKPASGRARVRCLTA